MSSMILPLHFFLRVSPCREKQVDGDHLTLLSGDETSVCSLETKDAYSQVLESFSVFFISVSCIIWILFVSQQ